MTTETASKALIPFWCTFKDRPPACVEDLTHIDAVQQAEKLTGKKVTVCRRLPYPASPRISENKSLCPNFCYTPRACWGLTSCPKNPACSE